MKNRSLQVLLHEEAVLDPELCLCWRVAHRDLCMYGDAVYHNCVTLLPQPVSVYLYQAFVSRCPAYCSWLSVSVSFLSVGLCLMCPHERSPA